MNFALNALFCASSDLRLDTLSLKSSRHEPPITSSVRGLRVEEADDGELRAKDDEDACLHWKTKAEDKPKIIEHVDRKTSNSFVGYDHPDDIIHRLTRLESEVSCLQPENTQLKETLKTIENAKDMAVEKDEEEEAKDAQDDKQRHLASERRMKRERGDALAALQEQSKHNRHPRPKLEVEHFFNIRRIDMQTMMMFLVWHQMNVTEKFREWYKEWSTSAKEERKVFSSEDVNDEKKKLEKLYGGYG
ncbi:hypothetical protein B0T12DRAFT_454756 [Alternaria alternata]|nr:hypothetical protein B0T12DRAFT_454756 [Alternaria alternata]